MKFASVHGLSLCGLRVLLGFSSMLVSGIAETRTPVVLFPGWPGTKLQVKVQHQRVAPGCPENGTFENMYFIGSQTETTGFSHVCQDKLMTLVYNRWQFLPMFLRFSDQPGVTVTIRDYGMTESAPNYEPLYLDLEKAGWDRKKNIRVAGYDSRLTPDLGYFLLRTIALIEETYHKNGNTPVHLVCHSAGGLYVQYLLTHTSQDWKSKYIHGFTALAGTWPGQGSTYSLLFTGFNSNEGAFPTSLENARSSALMYQSWPSIYLMAADPAVFKNTETVIQTPSATYTPQDYPKLFHDAGMALAEELGPYYIGFVRFQQPQFFPDVDVYAEKGSGQDTVVGMGFPSQAVGQLVDATTHFFTLPGDGNQEDMTNDSIKVWATMKCFRFKLTDNPLVYHFDLPFNKDVLARLVMHLQQPRSVCSENHQEHR
jgi:lecithin-cholesterol acyltransferase